MLGDANKFFFSLSHFLRQNEFFKDGCKISFRFCESYLLDIEILFKFQNVAQEYNEKEAAMLPYLAFYHQFGYFFRNVATKIRVWLISNFGHCFGYF